MPTVKLLDQYEANNPDHEFWFVIGTDLIPSLHLWVEGERLMQTKNFLVFERAGYSHDFSNWPVKHRQVYAKQPSLLGGISSTEVRQRVKANVGAVGLATPSVLTLSLIHI